MASTWEDQISLNGASDHVKGDVGPARQHLEAGVLEPRFARLGAAAAVEKDVYPIPETSAREGYYGANHLNYWLSGLRDSTNVIDMYREKNGRMPSSYLDFGGASGRVARHMKFQHAVPLVQIADINREHVNWVLDNLGGQIFALQSHSVPHLPFEDATFDLITAFSVFSHIETFDETWLCELRRILKPGGLLILTANIDNFQDIDESWPVWNALWKHPELDKNMLRKPLDRDRLVVRWQANQSYSSIVFYRKAYVEKRWAQLFGSMEIKPRAFGEYQTGVIFRKATAI